MVDKQLVNRTKSIDLVLVYRLGKSIDKVVDLVINKILLFLLGSALKPRWTNPGAFQYEPRDLVLHSNLGGPILTFFFIMNNR